MELILPTSAARCSTTTACWSSPSSAEKWEQGTSLPGTLDVRKDVASAAFQPRLENVEIGTILKAFNYPIALTGQLSLAGDFSGTKIDADAFRRSWQGQAHVELKDTRMEGLNFQQLVQQAVERSSSVKANENYDSATRLDSFTSELALDNGQLSLDDMQGTSSLLALTGTGALDLVKETADTRFNVRVKAGWEGEGQLVEFLKETPIPLRVYGKWQALNYSLQVDQILRKHLQDEAKRRLNDWADRNKETQSGKDVKNCSISCDACCAGWHVRPDALTSPSPTGEGANTKTATRLPFCFYLHLKIHLIFTAQRYQLHLLHAMALNLQGFEHVIPT